jgi:hypothetical protein
MEVIVDQATLIGHHGLGQGNVLGNSIHFYIQSYVSAFQITHNQVQYQPQ